jgi:hypothetical protein
VFLCISVLKHLLMILLGRLEFPCPARSFCFHPEGDCFRGGFVDFDFAFRGFNFEIPVKFVRDSDCYSVTHFVS